jgi:hypothetical protein
MNIEESVESGDLYRAILLYLNNASEEIKKKL